MPPTLIFVAGAELILALGEEFPEGSHLLGFSEVEQNFRAEIDEEMAKALLISLLANFPGLRTVPQNEEVPGPLLQWLSDPANLTPDILYAVERGLAGVERPNQLLSQAAAAVAKHEGRLHDQRMPDCV